MSAYILKRIILLVPILFGITLITFSLMKALPGDPVFSLVGERSSPEIIARIKDEIGGDKDIFRQYTGYISLLISGQMGRSYYTNRNVSDDILEKLPNTAKLAFSAMLIAAPLGILLGFAAAKKTSFIGRLITIFSVSGISVPVFWSGLMLMLFFSLRLKFLPPSGTGGIQFLVLPAVTLSLPALSAIARVARTAVMEIHNAHFIRTARANGISERRITCVHTLRNSLIPIITIIGLEFGSYLNGAVLTETIFGWDGIGRYAMDGIVKRDYPVIMGCILAGTMIFVIINIAVDILYHAVDPRMKGHGAGR